MLKMASSIWITVANRKVREVPVSLAGSFSFQRYIRAVKGVEIRENKLTELIEEKLNVGVRQANDTKITLCWEIDDKCVPPLISVKLSGQPLINLSSFLKDVKLVVIARFFAEGFNKDPMFRFATVLKQKPFLETGEFVSFGNEMGLDLKHFFDIITEAATAGNSFEEVDEALDLDAITNWKNGMERCKTWDILVDVKFELKEDLQIVTEDGAVNYHQILLEGVSPAIDDLLSMSGKSMMGNQIHMPETKCADVRLLLDFIDGKINEMEGVSDAISGLKLAIKYGVEGLKGEMIVTLMKIGKEELNTNEAMELFIFAINVDGLELLVQKALEVIGGKSDKKIMESKYFLDVVRIPDFFKFFKGKSSA